MLNIFTAMKLGMTFCTNISGFYWSRRAQSAAPTCAEELGAQPSNSEGFHENAG